MENQKSSATFLIKWINQLRLRLTSRQTIDHTELDEEFTSYIYDGRK